MRILGVVLISIAAGCGDNTIKQSELPDLSSPGGPAAGAIGAPCTNGTQCSLGVCLPIGRCSHTCPLPACELGWSCAALPGQINPVCQCPTIGVETCNGIDDDCNGIVDDNAVCPNGGTCIKSMCQCLAPSGSFHAKFVAKEIDLPTQRTDFAVDLNGDGKADNQYGNIIGALTAQGGMPQTSVNMQVMNGQILLLVDERSNDSQLTADGCAGAEVTNAKAMVGPDFSGNGSFTVDSTVVPGQFAGTIATGTFLSGAPATATTPTALQVYLPLFTLTAATPATLVPLTGGAAQVLAHHRARPDQRRHQESGRADGHGERRRRSRPAGPVQPDLEHQPADPGDLRHRRRDQRRAARAARPARTPTAAALSRATGTSSSAR